MDFLTTILTFIKGIWAFILTNVASFIWAIITFVIIVAIGWFIAKFFAKFLYKILVKSNVEPVAAGFICSVVKVVIVIISVIAGAGNNMTSLVAAISAAGLTASFALQGSLSNFISGMQLIFSKPFKTNDFLTVSDNSGTVKEINVLNTVLTTIDNKEIIIPNSLMTSGVVVNYSARETRRVDLSYSVSYNIDTDIPKSIISTIIDNCDKILKDPAPMVVVGAHQDSSMEIIARVWVNAADYWDVYFFMQETVKKEFDKNNVEIPFPQLDVHSK